MKRCCSWVLFFAMVMMHASRAEEAAPVLRLKERLAIAFEHELVECTLPEKARAWKAVVVCDASGHPLPSQRIAKDRIAIMTDLAPLEEKIFTLRQDGATPGTDLLVTEEGEYFSLTNVFIGVRIPRTLSAASNGPIAGICLGNAAWEGGGNCTWTSAPASYEADIAQQGPIVTEICCTYGFGDAGVWTIRFRLTAGEPAVLIHETSTLASTQASVWNVRLALPGKKPVTDALYRVIRRDGQQYRGHAIDRFVQGQPAQLALTAWFPWSQEKSSVAMAFYHLPDRILWKIDEGQPVRFDLEKQHSGPEALQAKAGNELAEEDASDDVSGVEIGDPSPELLTPGLVLAVGHPQAWVRDGENGIERATIPVTVEQGALALTLPLDRPEREWLIGSGTLRQIIVANDTVSQPQKLYAKHFETSLQMINEMVLDWPSTLEHPSLLFDTSAYTGHAPKSPIYPGTRTDIMAYYCNADPEVRKANKERVWNAVLGYTGQAMTWFLPRDGACSAVASNQGPHEQGHAAYAAAAGTDLLLDVKELSAEEKALLRARLAFLCYRGSDSNLINIPKKLCPLLPNMIVYNYIGVGMMAMVLADHPHAPGWIAWVSGSMERDLAWLPGDKGEWYESPHYQSASTDGFMWFGLAARKAGISEVAYDMRLRKSVEYLAKICTPPDPRFHDYRHIPEIGNTYIYETTAQFAAQAAIWRERDPDYAQRMQWMWQQQGAPEHWCIGGEAGIHWHLPLLIDPGWKAEKTMDLGSEIFPRFGAVLRSHYPSDRETYLLHRMGSWMQHYDVDQGQIILWGKGRPLSVDWGYFGCMPAWQHSRVVYGGAEGQIEESALLKAADYTHGNVSGWHREILFVKDATSEGPSWFLFHDRIEKNEDTAAWWYWMLTTQPAAISGNLLCQKGTFDVDCDYWFRDDRHLAFPRLTNREVATLSAPAQMGKSNSALGSEEESDLDDPLADEADRPDAPSRFVKAMRQTIRCGASGNPQEPSTTQYGLELSVSGTAPLFWAAIPRLSSEPAPKIVSIANGFGVKLVHARGIDYAFLGPAETAWSDEVVSFTGTVGTVQIRGEIASVALLKKGELACGALVIKTEASALTKTGKWQGGSNHTAP